MAEETKATAPEIELQLRRIFASPPFRNSPVLQSLLRFITLQTSADDRKELNEYAIAAEVFGRSSDFDSSADTIVRTQAYRLRQKLDEYYRSDGRDDPILIEVPKGHYVPVFHRRSRTVDYPSSPDITGTSNLAGPMACAEPDRVTEAPGIRYGLASVIGALALCCFGIGVLVGHKTRALTPEATTHSDVDSFWLNFLGTDRQPIVAYTNSLYLATTEGDLLRFSEGPVGSRGASVGDEAAQKGAANHSLLKHAGHTYFEDDLTGVGEVAAATALTEALSRIGAKPLFKRSRLISTSDLSSHNAIFLGSPFVNVILNDVLKQQNFLFVMKQGGPLLWTGEILNTRPQAGEALSYKIERDASGVIRTDYGLISQMPGLVPGRKIILLGGLTTSGTEAAAEFVTTVESVRLIAADFHGERWPGSFDCLLRVHLNQGLDIIRSECIASRAHH